MNAIANLQGGASLPERADDVASESERRTRFLSDAAFEGLAISQDGIVREVNRAFATMFGYDAPHQMDGLSASELAAPEFRALLLAKIAECNEEPYEATLVRRDGSRFEAELRGRRITLGGLTARATAVRDTTSQRRSECALRESEARLAEAQSIAGLGSWSWEVATGAIAWSEQLFRLFDLDPANGEPTYDELTTYFHPDDVATHLHATEQAIAHGTPFAFDIRVLRRDGTYRWMHTSGRGEIGPLGCGDRLCGTLLDIHDRKLLEEGLSQHVERLRRSEMELHAVLETAPVILYATDAVGIVTLSEGSGLTGLGLRPGEVIGRSVFEFTANDSEMNALIRRALQGECVSYTAEYSSLFLHTELRPTFDTAGAVVGLIGVCFDISESKQAEKGLLESRHRLALATESAEIGIWDWDVVSNQMVWDLRMAALYGIEELDFCGTYEAWANRIHPDDRETVEAVIAATLTGAADFHTQFRITWPNGAVRHIEAHALMQCAEDGSAIRMTGVNWDISERCEAELEREQSEERFRVLFEHSSDAHLLFDESGIIDANPAAVTMLGCFHISDLLTLHPARLSPEFQPDGRRSDEKCIEMDSIARDKGFHRFEWTHRKMDGTDFPVEVSLTHVTIGEKPVLLVVWHDLSESKEAERQIAKAAEMLTIQRDQLEKANAELIAQQALLDERLTETAEMNVLLEAQRFALQDANERLSALATTDGLTEISNHRAFQDRLEDEIERSRRSGSPLSIAILDVDRFKAFNDDYGHQAGDTVLRSVAEALRSTARKIDIVARYGGEEFAVILPNTAEEAGFLAAERFRKAIAEIVLPVGSVTASFGVATLGPSMSRESLIESADQAMYQSKRSGRNRTTAA